MSYGGQYNLNQRLTYLESVIQQIEPILPVSLAKVLIQGNSAGATDIDMNNQDILQVNNIDLTTINGSAYPPSGTVDTLSAVLTAGNSAGANDINLNFNDITNANQIDFVSGANTASLLFDPLAPANFEITCSGDLELRPIGSIDCNGATIDLTNGRIIKCDDIESPNNVDLNIICKGTADLVIETGSAVRLTIADTGVATFTALPECSVAPTNDNQLVNKLYTDQRITHSYFTDFNSADGGDFTWNSSGAGSSSIFNGTFDATLATVGLQRSGLLNLNSSATSGNNVYYQSANASWNAKNIKSITFGLIPLGNGSLTTVGTDAGNINQAFGIASGVSAGDTQATSIIWRISSGSASIPTWTLVENNVVKETLSGANLTGGLTNKWCRASIVFTNNGSNFYGVFTNLTDNVSYTTATFSTTTPNTFCSIYLHSGTANNTAKQIAFDYCLVENNCLDVGTSTNVSSSR